MTSPSDRNSETTHFGYARVAARDKANKVKGVFDSVAERYDLMNDVMSVGMHRWWKRFTIERTGLKSGQCALDVAAALAGIA